MRNSSRPLAATALAVLCGFVAAGCKTADDPFPNTGGVFVVLRDVSLGTQASPAATRQFTTWRVEALKLSLPDRPDYSFTPNGTCSILAVAGRDGDPGAFCGASALTLEATGEAREATFRLDLARMESISARRPSLPAGQDYDGDGVVNSADNCPIVSNPTQEVDGDPATGKPGKVCAVADGDGKLTLSDQDQDTVRDGLDNCLWYPNPLLPPDTSQTDVNGNGIGDLCEVSAPITFSSGARLSLECQATLTIQNAVASLFIVDFTDALSCDVAFGVCSLDASKVTVRLEDASAAKACEDVTDQPSR
jgi:hypothetical protein